jgi:hypothetical protein
MKEDTMAKANIGELGKIVGYVIDRGPVAKKSDRTQNPVVDARVDLHATGEAARENAAPIASTHTDANGYYAFKDLAPGNYHLRCDAFLPEPAHHHVKLEAGVFERGFEVALGLRLSCLTPARGDETGLVPCDQVTAGTPVTLRAEYNRQPGRKPTILSWTADQGRVVKMPNGDDGDDAVLITAGTLGTVNIRATLSELNSPSISTTANVAVLPAVAQAVSGQLGVTLQRTGVPATLDLGLWAAIRNRAKAISFGGHGLRVNGGIEAASGYQGFIDRILCGDETGLSSERHPASHPPASDLRALSREWRSRPVYGMTAYDLLKAATEVFLLFNCGVAIRREDLVRSSIVSDNEEIERSGLTTGEIEGQLAQYLGPGQLPYIRRIVQTAFPDEIETDSVFCTGLLSQRVDCPCLIELIWSYWHEEGMLAQTLGAISRRFQNMRAPGDRDPLAHLEIDPLRPLSSLLWGYVQDEQNRLTVKRRAYEYDHEYGLTLYGKAVPLLRSADSRSKFLEAFHNLLHHCFVFYKEDNDTTVIADGFPLLNALKEVHLLLAQGFHNQCGSLPWKARIEMLTQQWLLARPEIRDFLQSRPMVPYIEAWMPPVDTMKTLQGWSDVTVTHFRDLGVYGEQILLTIRFGDWIDVNDENSAKNWARYWRPEIQGYLHAYRAATGVDLTNPKTVDHTLPAVHLQNRLALQRAR